MAVAKINDGNGGLRKVTVTLELTLPEAMVIASTLHIHSLHFKKKNHPLHTQAHAVANALLNNGVPYWSALDFESGNCETPEKRANDWGFKFE